ncbi:MAG: replication-associated recombination protein A [bacterium]|nr:replication-associated recombination protein A [bacterium]
MKLLADKLRPTTLEDVIGQEHLIGKGKIIRNLVENKKIFSMILYGPPGTGKTTLAKVIANEINIPYQFLNATQNNKNDFEMAMNDARLEGEKIIIIDEIHRMNKDKQDILLPYLESGTIILIGLTTSNPYLKVNPAIRSRCTIFELKNINKDEIIIGLNKAKKNLENIKITDEAINAIASISGGDLRSAYNLLEVSYFAYKDKEINKDDILNISNKSNILIDNNDDGHYDALSALQKSIRGSDVNASLHYLARLIYAGDLDSIERRLSVIAYEDIGLANPGIGPRLDSAINAAERVGLPEAQIILANIVVEMALSPKSNSTYLAINKAMEDLKFKGATKIPNNIRTNSSTYLYPHNYKNHYVKQNYLPDEYIGVKYYIPQNNNIENNLNKVFNERTK